MTPIYKLRFDRFNYMVFEIDPHLIAAQFGNIFALNKPFWMDFWQPLDSRFIDESDKKNVLAVPDITCWFTDNLVLNTKAYNAIGDTLATYGELLPIKCEGIPYWILHVTKNTGMEAVDLNKSERIIEEGGFIDMQKLVFKEKSIKDLLLFKTEFSDYRNIYCTEHFKQLVEKSELKGLLFSTDLVSIL